MIDDNYIHHLPGKLRTLIILYLIVSSIGYLSGLAFVNETTAGTPEGIVENYNGNEENEDAEEMKFKKSSHEMINIIHTHILSMSMIFFILAGLVYGCRIPGWLKSFLMIEPLISVLVTFSGIYLIWLGYEWMTYIVMLSGALMTLSFVVSTVVILFSVR